MSDSSPAFADALKCHGADWRKFHGEAAGAQIAPELLAEQRLDIRLIVNHENEQASTSSSSTWQ